MILDHQKRGQFGCMEKRKLEKKGKWVNSVSGMAQDT